MKLFSNKLGVTHRQQLGQSRFSMAHAEDATHIRTAKSNITHNMSKFTLLCTYRRLIAGVTTSFIFCGSPNRLIWQLNSSNKLRFTMQKSGGTNSLEQVTTPTFTDTASWHTLMMHVDEANATPGDRCKTFHDGVEVTTFDTDTTTGGALATDFANYNIGSGDALDASPGLIYQAAIVTDTLVAASDVYDTVSSKPKDFRGLSNLAMLVMQKADGTVRDLANNADFTVNGGVPCTLIPDLA